MRDVGFSAGAAMVNIPETSTGLWMRWRAPSKKAKGEEEADVLLGLCSARASGKSESDSSVGAGGRRRMEG